MSNGCIAEARVAILEPLIEIETRDLHSLLERRRSIRRLQSGPFTPEIKERLLTAIGLTPAAFNLPPWHVVLIHDTREAFWSVVESGFRDSLDGDRLERYLDRLDGFRSGVAIALIFEDRSVHPKLRDAWQISDQQASSFVQQGLGMLQLSLWLSLTSDGLVTSLQHWDWLLEEHILRFVGLPGDRYHLSAALPIGYPDEPPRSVERVAIDRVVSLERVEFDLSDG